MSQTTDPPDQLQPGEQTPDAQAAVAVEPATAEPMTSEQLAEAKQYNRLELLCGLADMALDVVFLAVMAFVFARPIDAWLGRFLESLTLRLSALFLITFGLHLAISFPLSFYSGFKLEHRFGLSRLSLVRWLLRYAGKNALGMGFALALFVGLYWVIWWSGPWWWLVAAGLFFVVSIVVGQLFPVLIMPLFYKVRRLENPELESRMARLAAGTGLSIEGVYRFEMSTETVKANAMLAGLGSTRRVLMGDTLLDGFSPDEIEVILAHEIGHHVFRHIRKLMLAGVVYSVAGFWICDRLLWAVLRHSGEPLDYARLPVWTLPFLMLVLTVFGLLVGPLQNVISRRYERQCDRYALQRTGLKQAFISAFRKLAKLNKSDPDPHPLEVFLFHSHPPITERLALADE